MNASFRQRGGGWVLGQIVLMLAVVGLGWVFPRNIALPGVARGGAALMAVGSLLGLAGLTALRNKLTPFPKPRKDSGLVQHGVYALMRHPLYTSLMLTALGWALFRQSGPALAATPALILFFDAKARREERWLKGTFPQYTDYQRRVRRFVPGIY